MIIQCPHCQDYIEIEKLNCGIFRHATYISNGLQIPPHSRKEICDELFAKALIYGCGKPFKINANTFKVEICEYI